jgi:phage tail-like protein
MKQAEIEQLLPGVFQQGLRPASPLRVVLELMEWMHEPSERMLDEIDRYFDPRRTTDPFVPFLADWVGLTWVHARHADDYGPPTPRPFPTGGGRLSELVASSAFHTRWRGTRRALLQFLEAATGVAGFELAAPDESEEQRPYHFTMRVPQAAARQLDLVRRIVDHEKPAHVTYELEIAEEKR